MKRLIYLILRAYVRIGLYFYFSKIRVYGRGNIARKGAVMFTANHQNAFLDALLIVTHNGRKTHFLARAEVFKKKFVQWLLSLINMMPIFRIRDGWQTLSNNDEIFAKCYQILSKKETLLIFPEGNHGFDRRLRSLSKGFTRIAFGTLQKSKNLDLKIIPVGINYRKHQGFRSSVSIHYGEALDVKPFFKGENDHNASLNLRNALSEHMKQLTVHIEEENYEQDYSELLKKYPDFSNLEETMMFLRSPEKSRANTLKMESVLNKILYLLFRINFIFPLLIWKKISSLVQDPVMLASIKFSVGISIFPLFLLIQGSLISLLAGSILYGLSYILICLMLVLLLKEKNPYYMPVRAS